MSLGVLCRKWIGRLIGSAEAALAVSGTACSCCGNIHKGAFPLPVCRSCWSSIPWIHQVSCDCCGRYEDCGDCSRRGQAFFYRNRSAVRYDEQMKSWLAMYKYRGMERLCEVLGPMLVHAYQLHQQRDVDASSAQEIITFVPLSQERYAERGFNQAEQMARALGRLTRLPVISLLERTRHTDKQSFKARVERLDDMKGVFRVAMDGVTLVEAMGSQNVRIYIVDDVYTTGSTLNECARTMKMKLPQVEICGINWAR